MAEREGYGVYILGTLPVELAPVRRQMALQIAALHAAIVRCSRSLLAPRGSSAGAAPPWSAT
jgi:hypothetical protein